MDHPFYMDFDALSRELMTLAYGVGISGDQSRELVKVKLASICKDYACRAAGIMGNDPEGIEALVWYRADRGVSEGHPLTWKDHVEEIKPEFSKLIDERENALIALGIHPDSDSISLADEISRIRDEARGHFHTVTQLGEQVDKLKGLLQEEGYDGNVDFL